MRREFQVAAQIFTVMISQPYAGLAVSDRGHIPLPAAPSSLALADGEGSGAPPSSLSKHHNEMIEGTNLRPPR
jgi:hypothetical protein